MLANILISSILLALSAAQSDPLVCSHPTDELCVIQNVQLTRDDEPTEILASNPELVESVLIADSHIPVLPRVICDTFPNLQQLSVIAQGVEVLSPESLESCTRLEVLLLNNNSIQVLPQFVFRNTVALQTLHLYNNSIRGLSDDQFETNVELRDLHLDLNRISYFPVQSIRNSRKLSVLFLENNDLFDIEAEELAEFPELRTILLNYNLLPCQRLERIVEVFLQSDVIVDTFGEPKERIFWMCSVAGIACIEDNCQCEESRGRTRTGL